MLICGLDLSINGSGLTKMDIDSDGYVNSTDFMSFTSVKKNECENVYHYKKKDFNTYLDQNIWMRNKIKTFLKDVEYVAIEDYAFSASGKVFHMAEFAGMIKSTCYENGIPIRLYDVGSIKMHGCGKGNGDKISMSEGFDKLRCSYKLDLSHLPPVLKSNGNSPTSDIIDSFFICDLLLIELSLRKAWRKMENYDENIIKIFNRVTKSNPTNILARDFLQIT